MSFHAALLRDNHPAEDTPLIFYDVVTNQGDAYNDTTGYFTAPYNGTYFFTTTVGSEDWDSYSDFHLFVDSTRINRVFVYNNEGLDSFCTMHGISYLGAGQTAWVKSTGYSYNSNSSFSGFFISADLQ